MHATITANIKAQPTLEGSSISPLNGSKHLATLGASTLASAMAISAPRGEEYFTDEDYLPPRSPGLQPVKVSIAGFNGKKRGLSDELSEDDDLNFVGAPYPDISIYN